MLQPEILPEEARVGHDLLALRNRATALEAEGITGSGPDFADIMLQPEILPEKDFPADSLNVLLDLAGLSFCRFVLQPGMLPEEARLGHDLLALRHRATALQDQGITGPAADFADIILLVEGKLFR